jgi:uncharacterized protein (TIGR02145 family)
MAVFKNTYRRLDQDTAFNKSGNDSMFDCRNLRIISNEQSKTWALTSVKGNIPVQGSMTDLGYSTDFIIGARKIRDYVILFSTDDDTADPSGSYLRIWKAPFYDDSLVMNDLMLLYSGVLDCSRQHPIEEIVSFYEDDDTQKVYWTDNHNFFRFANVATYLTTDGLIKSGSNSYIDPDQFNIVQKMSLSVPEFQSITAGNIPVGMVQYCYRLYKLNGATSNFSPASQLFPLTESSMSMTNTIKFKGSDRLNSGGNPQSSGKGISLKIENIDTDYDRIEVIAIHYSALNEVPNIYIVDVKPVSSTVYVTDEGLYTLGGYLLTELNLLSNPFKCKTISPKFNILFAGGITQNEFDFSFDARAYRWRNYDGGIACILYEIDGSYWSNNQGSNPTLWTHYSNTGTPLGTATMSNLPVDIDAINYYNKLQPEVVERFMFKKNGSTIGGEGPNVSYTFGTIDSYTSAQRMIDDLGLYYPSTFGGVMSPAPYYYTSGEGIKVNQDIRSWARDEVYRVGMVGYDDKGRKSPVKWIGDIKTPNNMVNPFCTGTQGAMYSNPISINFIIDNIPTSVKYVQIVYVKRMDKDKTFRFQGKVEVTKQDTGAYVDEYYVLKSSASTRSGYKSSGVLSKLISIFSPDISFYKSHNQGANDFIEYIGTMDGITVAGTIPEFESLKCFDFIASDPRFYKVVSTKIHEELTPDEETRYQSIGTFPNKFFPRVINYSGDRYIGNLGISLITELNEPLFVGSSDSRYIFVNYRTDLWGSQYGGYTYEDRTRNEYIVASGLVLVSANSASPKATRGDIFIAYTDHLQAFYNQYYYDKVRFLEEVLMFPVESHVNLAYRLDDCYHRIYNNTPGVYYLREKDNLEIPVGENFYSFGWSDLYRENTAYKRLADAIKFLPAPIDYNPEFYNDTLIMASNAKEGRETIDPWTEWATNESIVVDKSYGPVNKLFTFKNMLLFFQSDAVGTLSVLDRSLVMDSAGHNVSLGEGTVLQRYDYISTTKGLSTRFSMSESANGVYWYDHKRRKIHRILNGIQDISTMKGVNSYLNKIDNTYSNCDNIISTTKGEKGFFMFFNAIYNEIWFVVKSSMDNGLALLFNENELIDAFTGFVDTKAYFYIPFENKLFSLSSVYLYREDKGYPGHFFGNFRDSFVNVIVNPLPNMTSTFTNLEITSEVYTTDLDPTAVKVYKPTLITSPVTSINTSLGTATCGGTVTNTGGATILGKGVVYGTSPLPTIENDPHTSNGTGLGAFVSYMNGLTFGSTYYVRAYAINSAGVGYGPVETIITLGYPTITTTQITNKTITTATSGGNVTSDGGEVLIAKGICWSTSPDPTVALSTKTNDGTTIGSFVSSIIGLTQNTGYYVRAYATNSFGTKYGEQVYFITDYVFPPVFSTKALSYTTSITTQSGALITISGYYPITSKGVCWNTNINPTIANSKTVDGTGPASFNSSITGLVADTHYYLRAYITNDQGVTYYSNQLEFTTSPVIGSEVITLPVTNLGTTTVTGNAEVISDGGLTMIERGICWSIYQDFIVSSTYVPASSIGVGAFSVNITGLTAGTIYYAKGYFKNSAGYHDGNVVSFNTNPLALGLVQTTDITGITKTTAVSGGNAISDGGEGITARGVCWSINTNPTITDSKTIDGSGTGIFVSTLTGLTEYTTYNVRAYVTNAAGTAYGQQKSFTTDKTAGTIYTGPVSSITQISVDGNGEIQSFYGHTVTARGFGVSTDPNATLFLKSVTCASGLGSFTGTVIDLTPGTNYYIWSWGQSVEDGIVWGNRVAFTTSPVTLGSITTSQPSNITKLSADLGGNALSDGGDAITEKGVCWSTSPNPTINDNSGYGGTGLGAFTVYITPLQENTHYYVRAYATNSAGTVYGNEVSFTTDITPPGTVNTAPNPVVTKTYPIASVLGGGDIPSFYGEDVIARGIGISYNPNFIPTSESSFFWHTNCGTGLGAFTGTINGLDLDTTYYLWAWGVSAVHGFLCGNRVTFTVGPALPAIVTTELLTPTTSSTITVGGNVISAGDALVTGRGFCYATHEFPDINDNVRSHGSGLGYYTDTLTDLVDGTIYYIRAYATTSIGTSYGNQVADTTIPIIVSNDLMDHDDNIYTTIRVGDYEWCVQNFKCEKYANGELIPYLGQYDEWIGDTIGACCRYDNSEENKTNLGMLYNGYAIKNGNILPYLQRNGIEESTWHIATKTEYEDLINSLGGGADAIKKMKQTGTIYSPVPGFWLQLSDASNESGLTLVGNGARLGGSFYDIHMKCYLWCADQGFNEELGIAQHYGLVIDSENNYTFALHDSMDGMGIRLVRYNPI